MADATALPTATKAVTAVLNPVAAAINAIGSALTGLFSGSTYAGGQGDINDGHFENGNLAQLALGGNDTALKALAGRTNRYGYVHVPNKLSLHVSSGPATPTQPLMIGTDEKNGQYPDVVWGRSAWDAHDEAWDLFGKVMAARGLTVPSPLSATGHDGPTNLAAPFELQLPVSSAAAVVQQLTAGIGGSLKGSFLGIPVWVWALGLLVSIAWSLKGRK